MSPARAAAEAKRLAESASRPRGLTAERAAWIGFGVLAVVGVLLRGLLMLAQTPGSLGISDSSFYIQAARVGPFDLAAGGVGNPWPAGYPLFLGALHAIVPQLTFVSVVQHALGVATALLLFLAARLVAPALWGLLPAAVVLLAGPQIFLEHAPMAETLYTLLIAGLVYCGLRALGTHSARWAALAGALAAAAACVRVAGLPLVVVLTVWLAVTVGGTWRRRTTIAGAAALAAVLLFGVYLVEMKRATDYGGPQLTHGGLYGVDAHQGEIGRIVTNVGRFWSANERGDPLVGYGYGGVIDIMDTPTEESVGRMERYYPTVALDQDTGRFLRMVDYESATRLQGFPFFVLVCLALIGLAFARGVKLAAGFLAVAITGVVLLVPILYVYFDARYVVPGYGVLALSAAIGGAALVERYQRSIAGGRGPAVARSRGGGLTGTAPRAARALRRGR